MEDIRTNKTVLGVFNRAIHGTAEVGTELTQEAVPAAKCVIRTGGKVVHHSGEVLLRGIITLTNYMEQAQSASEVSKRLGKATDFETLKAANALPSGVSNVEEYTTYLDEQLNY